MHPDTREYNATLTAHDEHVCDLLARQIEIPGPWPIILPVAPAITPVLKKILGFKRRINCPEAYIFTPCLIQ